MSKNYLNQQLNATLTTKMSPLTLSTTAAFDTQIQQSNWNGLLLETSKLKNDLSTSFSKLTTTTPAIDNKLKIRFLIFAEDSDGIRFNIFDSMKISKTATPKMNTSLSTSPISSKLNNEMLTRMVFGSFPMVVSNRTAIKVHSLKNSNKTMISNVFVHYNTNNSKMNRIHKLNCNCRRLQTRRDSLNAKIEQAVNTKPIDIIKLNQTDIVATKTKEILIKNIETPQQSLPSSDVDSNNLSINHEQLNQCSSPCSSVPTYYGSYSGIYKRLMRSVSNSLISTATNSTAIQSNDLQSNTFNNTNEAINELDNQFDIERKQKRKTSVSIASNSSFTNNNSKENMDDICEKCIENQRYPKFKIGIAVIFCLPPSTPLRSPSSIPSSAPSSPLSVSQSPNTQLNHKKISKHFFDPLIQFPSLPSSPVATNDSKFSFPQLQQQQTMTNSINNENFYEFFFSHLPLIEYQIKELKEKIIQNLPLYFNATNGQSSTRSSFSSTSTNPLSDNHSTHSNGNSKHYNRSQFNQKMILDFEEYQKNFYLLYSSPRLPQPAWLTLINNRKLVTDELKPKIKTSLGHQLKVINSHTTLVCNSLINDFVYLNKIINPKLVNTQNIPQSIRLLNNFRTAFNLSPSHTSLNEKTQSLNSFLSVLLSTVLKHHLSWVYTVLPSNELNIVNQNTNLLRKQKANWTTILEKTNPYNPLWAQLGDLHGAVNQPLKLVRTVIVGKNKELIERLLFLLSYFIRCSNSSYFDISAETFDFDKLPNQTESGQVSSSSSASSASSPNSTYNKVDNKSPVKICTSTKLDESLNESDSFILNNNNNSLHLETSNMTISREVNVFELSIDPMSQLNAVLANAVTSSQFDNNKLKKYKKYKRNDDFCMLSLSSSSSIASPSSCSMSSSPLNFHIKTNKALSLTCNQSHKIESKRKQRNLSSNSFGENCSAQELPLIGCNLKPNHLKSTRMQDNFGYSLLASYCDEFVFEFVLHGTSDKSFLNDLNERLVFSRQNSIIDCQIQESVYIVVDVDEFDVKVYSSESSLPPTKEKSIPLVDSLVQSVLDMIKLFQNSEFVLLHMEDKLQELYTKAITLNQLKSQSSQIDDSTLLNLMELNDCADLDFLNRILTAVYLPKLEIN